MTAQPTEAVEFPDSSGLIIDYLQTLQADGAPVGYRNPTGPTRYITVLRTGGVQTSLVSEQAQFVVQCYEATDTDALLYAQKTRKDVQGMRSRVISGVRIKDIKEIGGPGNLPDPDAPDLERYTFTIAVHLVGATT